MCNITMSCFGSKKKKKECGIPRCQSTRSSTYMGYTATIMPTKYDDDSYDVQRQRDNDEYNTSVLSCDSSSQYQFSTIYDGAGCDNSGYD